MLRYATIISTCLLLCGISCSRVKQAQQCSNGTDPNTGECAAPVDPNASRIATMQAQLDAQTKQIQEMLQKDQAKQAEVLKLKAELADEKTPRSRKEAILKKLEDYGVIEAATQLGVSAATRALNKLFERWGVDSSAQPETTPQGPQ